MNNNSNKSRPGDWYFFLLIQFNVFCLLNLFLPGPAGAAEPGILTPAAPEQPRINGARIYGCRPAHPFIYRIAATGKRPLRFSASGLPDGLELDPSTGIITGAVRAAGESKVTLEAENDRGKDSRVLRIVCGDTLALTPPMGFNDWNVCYDRVTDADIRKAADQMVASGMADAGYQYVNIDDAWTCWAKAEKPADSRRAGALRDSYGHIRPNSCFPDMKALTDYIHAKGLKAGIYSSPGPRTCAGYAGSYKHEADDLDQISRWGFDLLKYDWCSYGDTLGHSPQTLQEDMAPYFLMGLIAKQTDRDIVFSLCQYGMDQVWKWGAKVGASSWRTGGDLGFELKNIFDIALKNAQLCQFTGPGAWNDPDFIQVGFVGEAKSNGMPQPCPLSRQEQYSFISLWSLISAPLIYSGDMEKLDAFTLNLLCNPEVIDIDQDPLGKSARAELIGKDSFVLVKDMEDGSKAVGLCNRSNSDCTIFADWKTLGLDGPQIARDCWRQKDIGRFEQKLEFTVPARGVLLLRLRAGRES